MPEQRRDRAVKGTRDSNREPERETTAGGGAGFKTRIVRNSVLLAIVPMVALLIGTLRYQYLTAVDNTYARYADGLNDFVGSLNNDLSVISQRARSLAVNRAVFVGLLSYLANDLPGINAFQHTFDMLLEDLRLYHGGISFSFFLADYTGLRGEYVRDMAEFPDPELLPRVLGSSVSQEVWSGRADRPEPHITLYRNVTSIVNHPTVLRVVIPYSRIIAGVPLFEDASILVVHFTQDGRVLYPADRRFAPESIEDFAHQNRYHLISSGHRVTGASEIHVMFPRSVSIKRFGRSAAVTTGFFLLFSAFIIVVAKAISKHITRDLEVFIDQLNATDLRAPLPESFLYTTGGELGVIKRKFIDVIDQLNSTYKELLQVRETRDHLEVELLQERFNPHLLYNSLAEITWLAHERNDTVTVTLIDALVNYYRIILNKGSNVITIENEVRLVQEYVRILNVIHGDRYKLITTVDSFVLPMFMLKHVLQPIVENSIVHGIQSRAGAGRIQLSGRLDGGMVIFEIRDNGVGLPESVLAEFGHSTTYRHGIGADTSRAENPTRSTIQHSGYGLRSISERLAAFYHETPYFVLENAPEGGAVVRIGVRVLEHDGGFGPTTESQFNIPTNSKMI